MDTKALYVELLKKSLTGSLYEQSAWEVVPPERGKAERSVRHPGRVVKSLVRQSIVTSVVKAGYALIRPRSYDPSVRADGLDWPLVGYTMIGEKRLDNLQACVETVLADKVPGDFIETGVWRGGACIFMRALLKLHGDQKRRVWLADSFQGLPPSKGKQDGSDISHVEFLKVSRAKVEQHFRLYGLLDDQVRFLEGWFADTLPTAPIEQLAILRLDGDLYSSTMDALDALFDKVSPGGFVIVDDYHTWPSCRRAVGDFCQKRGIDPDIQRIDASGAFWRVPGGPVAA
jgi:O-methyltransferase